VLGVRLNPPVAIDDWSDLGEDDDDAASDGEEPVDNEEGDPAYVEQDGLPGIEPENEPALGDEELWDFLQAELGDLADEEWIDMCKLFFMCFIL
jgi:hypothetical protein